MSERPDSGDLPSRYDLNSVFAAKDSREVAELYDHWADDYEQSVLSWGYLTPAVTSGLVGRFVEDRAAPVLDAGAGTGLMGEVLATLGYSDLVAIDISEKMLAHAQGKGVYRDVSPMELGQELDFPTGAFAAVVATGVFAAGHAPPESLDELVRVTRGGGSVIFSVRTDVLDDAFGPTQDRLEAEGRWERLDQTLPFSHFPLENPELKLQVFAYRVR